MAAQRSSVVSLVWKRLSTTKPSTEDTTMSVRQEIHAIRDLTADAFGGWKLVTNIQAGGGLFAQRIVTRRHYDMDGAKRKALRIAGLEEGDAR